MQTNMAKTEKHRFLRAKEVTRRVGLCAGQLKRLEKAGAFPRRIVIGKKVTGWLESEIDEWQRDRAENHRVGAAS